MSREVRRVPLDFAHPLGQVWSGYVRPDDLDGLPCPVCGPASGDRPGGYGDGRSPEARRLHALWYGYVPFDPAETGSTPFGPDHPKVWAFAQRNVERSPEFYGRGVFAVTREAVRLGRLFDAQWSHHLTQEDVDALVEAGRLTDFTHQFVPGKGWQSRDPQPEVTAEQVNAWSLDGFGHDSINCMVVCDARCEREGWPTTCPECDGHGSIEAYPGQRDDAENWEHSEPPTGEGWQLWETTTEGSPVSPVFATDRDLARWLCTDPGRRAVGFGGTPVGWDFTGALAFVGEGRSVASMLIVTDPSGEGGVMVDGSVAAILDDQGRPPTSQTEVEQLDGNGEPIR